jgi:hypothetical protein
VHSSTKLTNVQNHLSSVNDPDKIAVAKKRIALQWLKAFFIIALMRLSLHSFQEQ